MLSSLNRTLQIPKRLLIYEEIVTCSTLAAINMLTITMLHPFSLSQPSYLESIVERARQFYLLESILVNVTSVVPSYHITVV